MIEELTAEQRWMWIGFLLLAGDSSLPGIIFRRKDENGKPKGYSFITLAEMLDINLVIFRDGIRRMIAKEKINVDKDGVIFIMNWDKYQSEYQRQKPYREGYKNKSNQSDVVDIEGEVEGDVEGEKTLGLSGPLSESEIDIKFNEFWKAYPKEGRLAKKESRIKFGALMKRGELEKFIRGFNGYIDYLKHRELKEKFKQRPMYAKTFLNGRWQEFIEFKYEPGL